MHAAMLSILRYRTHSTGQYTYIRMFYNLNMVKNVQCRTPPICHNRLIWGAHTSELAFGKLTKTEGPPLASFICPRGIATALHGFIFDPVPPHCHQAKLLTKTGHPKDQPLPPDCMHKPVEGISWRKTQSCISTAGPGLLERSTRHTGRVDRRQGLFRVLAYLSWDKAIECRKCFPSNKPLLQRYWTIPRNLQLSLCDHD